MKDIRVLIVGKSGDFTNEVTRDLSNIPFTCKWYNALTLEEAYMFLLNFNVNLLIVDADDVESLNFKLLDTLNTMGVSIIIVSANAEHAASCYTSGIIVDFILKPFLAERLALAISRVFFNPTSIYTGKNIIFLQSGRASKRFALDEINFIEAYGIYVKIHTSKGKHVVNDGISKMESKLSHLGFIRIHKSYIVNIENVVEVSTNHVDVGLGKLPLGKSFRGDLERKLGITD